MCRCTNSQEQMMEIWILTGTLVVAAVYDLRFGRIPNCLICMAVILAGICMALTGDLHMICDRIGGLLLPPFSMIVLFRFGYFGAGDIKLCSVVGAFLGVKGVICSFGIALAIGAVEGGIKLIGTGQWRKSTRSKVTIRFALPMLFGTVMYLIGSR